MSQNLTVSSVLAVTSRPGMKQLRERSTAAYRHEAAQREIYSRI